MYAWYKRWWQEKERRARQHTLYNFTYNGATRKHTFELITKATSPTKWFCEGAFLARSSFLDRFLYRNTRVLLLFLSFFFLLFFLSLSESVDQLITAMHLIVITTAAIVTSWRTLLAVAGRSLINETAGKLRPSPVPAHCTSRALPPLYMLPSSRHPPLLRRSQYIALPPSEQSFQFYSLALLRMSSHD